MALTNANPIAKPARLNGTLANIYTCPSGKKAKVDSLIATNVHSGEYDFNLYLGAEASSVLYYWVNKARLVGNNWEPGGRKPFVLEVKQTLEAGQTLQGKIEAIGQTSWNATSYDAHLWVSIIEFTV